MLHRSRPKSRVLILYLELFQLSVHMAFYTFGVDVILAKINFLCYLDHVLILVSPWGTEVGPR